MYFDQRFPFAVTPISTMGWMDKALNTIGKAAGAIANPFELGDLDNIVNDLARKYDNLISSATNPDVPSEADCNAAEDGWRAMLIAEYDEQSRAVCRRTQANDDDNIAVRRRILNRQFNARHGQLYARYTGAICDRRALAACTISACIDSLNATVEAVENSMPNTPDYIRMQFDALDGEVTTQVNATFPGGEIALDKFDDGLPDGVPSMAGFRAKVQQARNECLERNERAVENAVASIKLAIREATIEQLTQSIAAIKSTLNFDIPFIEKSVQDALMAEASAELDEVVVTALTNLMDKWAPGISQPPPPPP